MRRVATRGGVSSWPARRVLAWLAVTLTMAVASVSLAAAAASGWSIQSTPDPTSGNGDANHNQLFAVSCPSLSACTAVGRSGIRFTLAERWDGTGWSIQPTPNPAGETGSQLLGVSCPTRTACTAVGTYWSGRRLLPLVERWDGNRWRIQPTHGKGYLTSVSCPSRRVCTAVGNYGNASKFRTEVERWDGNRWRIQPTPNPAGPRGRILDGVSCPSRSTCTAVGSYVDNGKLVRALVERWNGTRWKVQPAPNPAGARSSDLSGVSCASPSVCITVGDYINHTRKKDLTLAERWNGTTWRVQRTPNPTPGNLSGLDAVSCSSRNACTAVSRYYNNNGKPFTLAERWNGTSWRIQPTPNATGANGSGLDAVSCSSRIACTAAGTYYKGTKSFTLAERWDPLR